MRHTNAVPHFSLVAWLGEKGAKVVENRDKSKPAGGYATQRGINYQNRVAAYFAACCLAERIPLPDVSTSPLKSVRCETGEPSSRDDRASGFACDQPDVRG